MMKARRRPEAVRLSILLAGMLVAAYPCAFALDTSLDISQYAHTAWRVRDGFTKGTISTIAQTPDGYFWLGTEFGLLRFDGVRAVPWQPPPAQHLPSAAIFSLHAARDGTLWIGTTKGVASWKEFRMNVRDDGKGIDPQVLDQGGLAAHHGLPGMHERAQLVGTKLAIWSQPDSGTEIELMLSAAIAYAKGELAPQATSAGQSAG